MTKNVVFIRYLIDGIWQELSKKCLFLRVARVCFCVNPNWTNFLFWHDYGINSSCLWYLRSQPGGGWALAHFLRISGTTRLGKKNLHFDTLFRNYYITKNSKNNSENSSLLFSKTITYCSWTNSHNPFRNLWSIFIPRSGIYAKKWYPEKRHDPYRFIWKCPLPPPGFTAAGVARPSAWAGKLICQAHVRLVYRNIVLKIISF